MQLHQLTMDVDVQQKSSFILIRKLVIMENTLARNK